MVEAVEQGAPAGQHDASLHHVSRQLGRRLVQRHLHRVDDRRHRFLDGFTDLLGRAHDRLGQARDQVTAPDFGGHLLHHGPGRTHRNLDLLRSPLPDREAVLLLDELHDRLIELVAADAHAHARDHATERDDGNLAGPAAEVNHHVPGRLVNGHTGTDRSGHGLLDQINARCACPNRGFADRPPLDLRRAARHTNDNSR